MKLSKWATSTENFFKLQSYKNKIDQLHLDLFKIMEEMEKEFHGVSNFFYSVLEGLNSLSNKIKDYKKASEDTSTTEFSTLISQAMELAPHMYELEIISEEDLKALQSIADKV